MDIVSESSLPMRKLKKWLVCAILASITIGFLLAPSAIVSWNPEAIQSISPIADLVDQSTSNDSTTELGEKTESSSYNVCLPVVSYFEDRYELTASQTIILASATKAACDAGLDERKVAAISWAESRFTDVCNRYYGCRGGIGPMQIIRSTFKAFHCKGDIFDEDDNIECAIKIIKTSGYSHWGTADTWWGSYRAWWPLYLRIKAII